MPGEILICGTPRDWVNHRDPPQIRQGGGRKIGEPLTRQAVEDARREGARSFPLPGFLSSD